MNALIKSGDYDFRNMVLLNDMTIDSLTYDRSDTKTNALSLQARRIIFVSSTSKLFDIAMPLETQLRTIGHLSLLVTMMPTVLVLTTWTSLGIHSRTPCCSNQGCTPSPFSSRQF